MTSNLCFNRSVALNASATCQTSEHAASHRRVSIARSRSMPLPLQRNKLRLFPARSFNRSVALNASATYLHPYCIHEGRQVSIARSRSMPLPLCGNLFHRLSYGVSIARSRSMPLPPWYNSKINDTNITVSIARSRSMPLPPTLTDSTSNGTDGFQSLGRAQCLCHSR